jgi:hypothetical protein
MNKIQLLSAALGAALLGAVSIHGADHWQGSIVNHTDQPINVLLRTDFGKSIKVKNIPSLPDGSDPYQYSGDYKVSRHLGVIKNSIRVYYAQDTDFKYPFLSSEPKSLVREIIGELKDVIRPGIIDIYPTKITTSWAEGVQETELSTICNPCKTDSNALAKVKKHYKIQ